MADSIQSAYGLEGRTALVTGASRGIGAAIAGRLKMLGADVFGTATSVEGAERIAEALGTDRGCVLDVTDPNAAPRVLGEINERAAAPTLLVNNAAVTRDQLLLRMKDADWEAVIETNLTGVMRMTRAALKGMLKARAGRIISISSVVAGSGNPGQTNYAAAKAGMEGFSRSLAREVAARGITVNVVAPGFVDTDMTRALDDDQRDRLAETIPLGRLGQPADIAGAVGWLAGESAAWVTGQTLHVNGGMYMG